MSDDSAYVTGTPHGNRKTHPTVETKPSHPDYTGGGYEHARSTEYRPHTPGERSESVYASIHRLSAIVWCYDSDEPLGAILDDLRDKDVHHNAPEADGDRGIPWDNRECVLEAVAHGRHSEITQSQRRAWAADQKREVERKAQQSPAPDRGPECDNCGATDAPLATSDEFDGEWCPECIREREQKREAINELEDIEL
jgi:hypothetical protein